MLVRSCHVPFRKQVLQIFAKLCSVFHVAMEFLKPIASLQEGDMRSEIAHIWSNMKRRMHRMCSVIIQGLHAAKLRCHREEGGGGGGGQPLSMNSGHTEAA